jgi:U3 small nucleolar RNA-associated protein 21
MDPEHCFPEICPRTSSTLFCHLNPTCGVSQDHEAMLRCLMAKGPSALDLEVRSLGPEGGGSIPLLLQFITMLHTGLNARRYFEAVQAYLGLFLKVR